MQDRGRLSSPSPGRAAHAACRLAGPVEAPIFRVEVTTPEGALSDRRRVELVEGASKVICGIANIPEEEASQRVWVLCKEIAEGGWGAGGQVIQFQALREAAAAAREEEAAPVSSP